MGALSFKIGNTMWNVFPSLGEQSHAFPLEPGEKQDPDVAILDFMAQHAALSPFKRTVQLFVRFSRWDWKFKGKGLVCPQEDLVHIKILRAQGYVI